MKPRGWIAEANELRATVGGSCDGRRLKLNWSCHHRLKLNWSCHRRLKTVSNLDLNRLWVDLLDSYSRRRSNLDLNRLWSAKCDARWWFCEDVDGGSARRSMVVRRPFEGWAQFEFWSAKCQCRSEVGFFDFRFVKCECVICEYWMP